MKIQESIIHYPYIYYIRYLFFFILQSSGLLSLGNDVGETTLDKESKPATNLLNAMLDTLGVRLNFNMVRTYIILQNTYNINLYRIMLFITNLILGFLLTIVIISF